MSVTRIHYIISDTITNLVPQLLCLKLFNGVKIDIGQAVDQRFTFVDNHTFKPILPKFLDGMKGRHFTEG